MFTDNPILDQVRKVDVLAKSTWNDRLDLAPIKSMEEFSSLLSGFEGKKTVIFFYSGLYFQGLSHLVHDDIIEIKNDSDLFF